MALEFKKLYGIGCAVCDKQVFGPNGGVFPEDTSFDNIWYALRQEAEDEGWYTVGRGERSAFVCSHTCAQRWLRPDEFDQYGNSLRELAANSAAKTRAIREAATACTSFTAHDIVKELKAGHPHILSKDVHKALKPLIAEEALTLVKDGRTIRYSRAQRGGNEET